MDTRTNARDVGSARSQVRTQLALCRVEVLQRGKDRAQVEKRAKFQNQPMGSNFDGNCGGGLN